MKSFITYLPLLLVLSVSVFGCGTSREIRNVDVDSVDVLSLSISRHWGSGYFLREKFNLTILYDESFGSKEAYLHDNDQELKLQGIPCDIIDSMVGNNRLAEMIPNTVLKNYIVIKENEFQNKFANTRRGEVINPPHIIEISKIGYSKDFDYVMVAYSIWGEEGGCEIFKKINGKWVYVYELDHWVS